MLIWKISIDYNLDFGAEESDDNLAFFHWVSNSLTVADRYKTAGKPNADTTITLVMNHIKSENPVDSLTP